MKRWMRLLGLLLGIAATVAVVLYAMRTLREQDLSRYLSAAAIGGIAMAAVAYSLIIPLSAAAWRRLLKDMRVERSWSELAIIMSITQLAKYIPGNLGQHVGRAAMSVNRGIPLRTYGVSVVAEALLAVVAAGIVGLLGCGAAGIDHHLLQMSGARMLPYIALVIVAGVLAWVIGRRVVPGLLRRLFKRVAGGSPLPLPRDRTLLFALLVYIINYLVFGTGVAVMARLLLPAVGDQWLLLTGGFALAWVVGFFAPGAPAGLGVREGLLLALLQSSYCQADALLVVIAMRIATTAGDVLCFVVGAGAHLLRSRHGDQAALLHATDGKHHET